MNAALIFSLRFGLCWQWGLLLYRLRVYVNHKASKIKKIAPDQLGPERRYRQMQYQHHPLIHMTNRYRHRFDFDIGYLVKSPCRECLDRDLFPNCMKTCLPLEKIRTVLANSISCSRSHTSAESSAIFQGSRDDS